MGMEELEKLKAELNQLNLEYANIRNIAPEERGEFGRKLNAKKNEILAKIEKANEKLLNVNVEPLDITAPCAPNEALPDFYSTLEGSEHPLMAELDRVISIYQSMGFDVMESRQLDDEYHMFPASSYFHDAKPCT